MKKVLVVFALSMGLARAAYPQQPITVEVTDPENQLLGTATLSPGSSGGVDVMLNLRGLTPGEHSISFHETAACQGWTLGAAGGHFNPSKKKHGLKNPDGPHAGDMGSFTVGADGAAKTTVAAPGMTLGGGPNSVFANGGTALIINEGVDDMMTDPEGRVGERVGCSAITKAK